MRFSIIIPVYKTEEYVKQCVDSVLAQDFNDFELILVDNESPDSCPEICENYAKMDPRVKVIHKKHGRASSARNVGMKAAQGEYLCFLDSDDFWVDEYVLTKMDQRLRNSNADILELYNKFYYQSSNKYLTLLNMEFPDFDKKSNAEKIEYIINTDRLNPSAWGMCLSRDFVELNNGYFQENLITEDIEWCIRLFSATPQIDILPEIVYVYRKNREGSVTSTIGYPNLCNHCETIEHAPKVLADKDNQVHNAMMEYVSYQAIMLSAVVYKKGVNATRQQQKEISKRLQAYCKTYLRLYHKHPKVKKALIVYRFFGYNVMARVLGFYLNHRGR